MMQGFSEEARDLFVTGLRNAHAMENEALSIMEPQVGRIEHYPEVAERLRSHIEETRAQKTRLEGLLHDMNEDSSSMKDTVMSLGGSMAAMGHSLAGDEIVKNAMADFAFEHYEIAAYKSLIALARAGGLQSAEQVLQQNLAEEQAMAEWLDRNIEPVTLRHASLREVGETAKR